MEQIMIAKEAIDKLNMIKSGELIPVLTQQTPDKFEPHHSKYVRAFAKGTVQALTPITKPLTNHLERIGNKSLQSIRNGEEFPLGYHQY